MPSARPMWMGSRPRIGCRGLIGRPCRIGQWIPSCTYLSQHYRCSMGHHKHFFVAQENILSGQQVSVTSLDGCLRCCGYNRMLEWWPTVWPNTLFWFSQPNRDNSLVHTHQWHSRFTQIVFSYLLFSNNNVTYFTLAVQSRIPPLASIFERKVQKRDQQAGIVILLAATALATIECIDELHAWIQHNET